MTMRKFYLGFIALLASVCANAVTVTITTDEGFDDPAIIEKMQQNLGEIGRAHV